MEIAIQPNYLMEALYYFERRANGSTLAGVRTALNKSGDSAKIAHAAALAPIIELENRLNESLIVAGTTAQCCCLSCLFAKANPLTN